MSFDLARFRQTSACHCTAVSFTGEPDLAVTIGPVINGVTLVRLVYVCSFCGGGGLRVKREDELSPAEKSVHVRTEVLSDEEKERFRELTDDLLDHMR